MVHNHSHGPQSNDPDTFCLTRWEMTSHPDRAGHAVLSVLVHLQQDGIIFPGAAQADRSRLTPGVDCTASQDDVEIALLDE